MLVSREDDSMASSENVSIPGFTRNIVSINNDDTEDIITTNEETNLVGSVRRRVQVTEGNIQTGSLNVLSANLESLDYDICENHLLLDEERKKGYKFIVQKSTARWFIFLLIGMITALIACFIDISVEELSTIKYAFLSKNMDKYVTQGKLHIPYLFWVISNIVPVLIGSILVAYGEPIAAGSGIPQVKCYLNGVKIPRVVRIKTLAVKSIGVICSVVGGLAGGKEGPMIHSGAVVAAGISQGKSSTFNKDLNIFRYFREDHEKRDFVSGGAAAGVSAAFGAPVGGVLFSLEEGTSFWNQGLTWRTFFASVVSTFTLNIVLSTYHGVPGNLNFPGLLNLGKFDSFSYEFFELPIFLIMGAFGGLCGAMWNHINFKITVFRMRYIRQRWLKVIEACIVAAVSATAGCLMVFIINDCKPLGQDPTKYPTQELVHPGKYALIGAAAQLGGVVRMTISLTVIIMETTGNITFALPLIITLIAAKWTGDYFNEGIYDTLIQLSGVPLLPWEPPPLVYNIYASEVMSHPVVTLRCVENVGHIVELLKLTTYNGFPVVDPPLSDQSEVTTYGRIRGLILRSQLIVILQSKIFNETSDDWDNITASFFRNQYPRYPTIDKIHLTEQEKTYFIDLRPFMNPSPYTVLHSSSLPRMFRLFRALGLRHLPIVNDSNEVIGMVTRKDLARYRVWKHRCHMGVEELLISKEI
ncbi:chloride channel protein 7 isoform X2 [Leptinotarsa decemlineata]|uniref:chloride channel protein 7 isoform X2 n=1 Tax=Leptinotarsa decemlineata TaxID=7539 RepID=UPI003D306671